MGAPVSSMCSALTTRSVVAGDASRQRRSGPSTSARSICSSENASPPPSSGDPTRPDPCRSAAAPRAERPQAGHLHPPAPTGARTRATAARAKPSAPSKRGPHCDARATNDETGLELLAAQAARLTRRCALQGPKGVILRSGPHTCAVACLRGRARVARDPTCSLSSPTPSPRHLLARAQGRASLEDVCAHRALYARGKRRTTRPPEIGPRLGTRSSFVPGIGFPP